MEKNWARLADAKRRGVTESPLRPYRNHHLPQQVPERFDGLHPTFASACGAPPGHPTAKMNEIRQRTQVASRPGSILGVFGPENRRKCIDLQKNMETGVRDADGDASVWKKFGAGWRSRKKILRNPSPAHRYVAGCTKST